MAENRLSTITQFKETTPNEDDVILVSHKEGGQYVSNKAKISSLPFVNFKDYASKYEAGLMQVGAGLSVDGYGKVSVPTATASIDGLMSKEDKVKLNGIEEGANKYVLPPATDSTLGGIIVGSKLSIDNGKLDVDVSKLGLLSYYLPLNGGTMTGTIKVDKATTQILNKDTNDSFLELDGGTSSLSGAYLTLHGKDCIDPGKEKGGFTLVATNGNNQACSLSGNPNGKLTWNSKNIVRSINSNLTADINGNVIVPVATAKINGLMSKDDKAKIDSFSSTYIPAANIVNSIGIDKTKVVSQYLLSSQLSDYAPLTAIYYPPKELTNVTIHLSVDGGNDADAAKYIINHENAEREAHPFKTLPAAMNALQNIRSNSSSFNWIIKVWPGKYVFGGDNDNQGMSKKEPSTTIFHPDCFGAGESGNYIQIEGQHTTSGTPMYNDVIFEFYESEEPRITANSHFLITSRCKITNITFLTTNTKLCKLDENGKPKGKSTRWNLIYIGGAYVLMENVSLRYASTGINLNSASTLRVYRAFDVQYCRIGIADSDKNSIMQFFCGGFWENNKFTYYDNDKDGHCRFLNCHVGINVQNFTVLHGNAIAIFRMLFNNCNAAFNMAVDSHLQMTVNDTFSDYLPGIVPLFLLTIKKHLDLLYDDLLNRNGFDFDAFKAGTKNLQTNSTTFAILEKQAAIKSDHIIYETIS